MVMKIELAVRRPDQVDGRILPMIPTPAHFSFPSAHATEAYAVLTVLEALIKRWGSYADEKARIAMLRGLAERIAVNRTVAGVHFPIDSWAGAVLGMAVGSAVLGRCGENVSMEPARLAARDVDFLDHDLRHAKARADAGLTLSGKTVKAAETSIFSWLWSRALTEKQGV
jgi:hypothetical protein